jgi:hypothetical protein
MSIRDLDTQGSPEPAPIVKRRRIRIFVTIQDMDTVDGRDDTYFIIDSSERADTIYDIVEQPIRKGGDLSPIYPRPLEEILRRAIWPIARDLVRKANV